VLRVKRFERAGAAGGEPEEHFVLDIIVESERISAPGAAASGETPASAGIRTVHYTCADGRRIEARYDNSNAERASATLLIDGRRFEMYSVVAASGARYATESGFKPDHGLQWWTKGETATLSEMVMDHTAGGPRELTTCRAS
jgi:membrane-bound inhibitor of C-type lysozyme